MRCAWQAYLKILPLWMCKEITNMDSLLEARLRIGKSPKFILQGGSRVLNGIVTPDDIHYVINAVSHYSPWAASTISDGFITAPGGHRIGICGFAGNNAHGIIEPTSVCIRVAKDFPGISRTVAALEGSTLLLGPPGSGKTTFLRDLIREKSNHIQGSVSVIDEKQEIFPQVDGKFCFAIGDNTDVMSGCSKQYGITAVLKNMGPQIIAVDEITADKDCTSLIQAGWCGVQLIATAHAGCIDDLLKRPIYKPLADTGMFRNFVVFKPDKTWKLERI